jgi:hypothetical protein
MKNYELGIRNYELGMKNRFCNPKNEVSPRFVLPGDTQRKRSSFDSLRSLRMTFSSYRLAERTSEASESKHTVSFSFRVKAPPLRPLRTDKQLLFSTHSHRSDEFRSNSPFTLHPSPFTLHPSLFILHPSLFILHPSSFIPRKVAAGVIE